MYLYDAWYVAAWDHELTAEPLARTLLEQPVVLYRTDAGQAVALEDRCCHRLAPLSKGKVIGEEIQCGYHGLMFAADGACTKVPSQSRVPPDARVRSYPIVERHRWIWIWMGDPALADDTLIPDMYWHDSPDWACLGDRFYVHGAYQGMLDIAMDQTHSAYVHPTSLANDGALAKPPKVRRGDRTVSCARLMPDADPPPIWANMGNRAKPGTFDGNVDHWITWEYQAPSTMTFDVGIATVGTGAFEGNMEHAINIHTSHGCTPETPSTTHHFWTSARNFALDDAKMHEMMGGIRNTFLEDVAMVEATQRIIDLDPTAPTVDVNSDNPTIQARRLLERMIAERQAQAAE